MNLGQEITLDITDMTPEGRGIGRCEGAVVFVSGALWQDRIRAVISRCGKRAYEARCLEILQPSPARIPPQLTAFDFSDSDERGDGCIFDGLSYEAECRIKKSWIGNALQRIGGLEIPDFELHSGPIWGYRNKTEIKVQNGEIGFYRRQSHRLIPFAEHPLLQEAINASLPRLRQLARLNRGLAAITVMANEKDDLLVCLQRDLRQPWKGELDPAWIVYERDSRERPSRPRPVLSNTSAQLTTLPSVAEMVRPFRRQVGSRCYELSPDSFFQVNRFLTQTLFEQVRAFAALQAGEHLVELYSGVGAMSLYLVAPDNCVSGIEIVPEAVRMATANAKLNGIPNARYSAGRSEDLFAAIPEPADVLLVDPPRAGLDPKLIQAICEQGAPRLVYVSCNPASLARDLGQLSGHYRLQRLAAVDMFPRTGHVETVVLMSRVEGK